ncbi:MAG: hypothetical protein ACON38_09230, partial [Akkermansiaceae bacterium]
MNRKSGGFAVIATLTVMILLAMVSIAFLTLAAVQVQTGASSKHRVIAETNARLALMVALAELQRDMGPDQRVSASAEILEDTEEASVEQKHWTAVWKSAPDKAQAFIRRDEETGGLRDLREDSPEATNYLVSGNQGGFRARNGDIYKPSLISYENG